VASKIPPACAGPHREHHRVDPAVGGIAAFASRSAFSAGSTGLAKSNCEPFFSSERSACQRLGEVAAHRHRLTHGLHVVVSVASAPELLEANRGTLTTT